jgi:hypothetical protein
VADSADEPTMKNANVFVDDLTLVNAGANCWMEQKRRWNDCATPAVAPKALGVGPN